jgi:hypothetical protein
MKELPVNVWIENDGFEPDISRSTTVIAELESGETTKPVTVRYLVWELDNEYYDPIVRFKIIDPQQAIVEESENLGLYDSATLTTVINKMRKREQVGRGKYGTDVDRKDFTAKEWANHALEEAMDFVLYMQRLIDEMED